MTMTAKQFIDRAGGDPDNLTPFCKLGRSRAEYLVKRYGSEILDYTKIYEFSVKMDNNRRLNKRYRQLVNSNEIEKFVDYIIESWYKVIL